MRVVDFKIIIRKEGRMEKNKSHIIAGVVLLSIGLALLINYFSGDGSYYGPIILLGVGLGLLIKYATTDVEKRKSPIGGIILVVLGALSLIDILTGSNVVVSMVKAITPLLLPIILVVLGLRYIFK